MNKTEARFCTSSEGIAAFLLWHSVYPDRIAELREQPTLLYFKEKDYNNFMNQYWQGFQVPTCELSECLMVVKRICLELQIQQDWFFDMWDEIYDMRTDYKDKGQMSFIAVQ